MVKFFLKTLSFFFVLIISITIYLSYFGLKTDRFDSLIKNKANELNTYVKLSFRETKIYINPIKLNLIVKLQNPKVLIGSGEIILSKLDFFLPIGSFFSSDFILRRAEVAFKKNDIKDLTKISKIFLPNILNKQLKKIFKKGSLEGEFTIPFNEDGSIGEGYGFSGKILDAQINITNEIYIKNLTTDIKHIKSSNEDIFNLIVKNGTLLDIDLLDSEINIKRQNDIFKIESLLNTKGKFNLTKIKKITSLLRFEVKNFNYVNATADLNTKINLELHKKLKIRNLSYSTEGNISSLRIKTNKKKIIEEYLPDYDPNINIKGAKIKITNSKKIQTLDLEGFIKINDNYDKFKVNEKYNYDKKYFDIDGYFDLTNSKVEFNQLNYIKNNGIKSKLEFKTNFALDNYYKIIELNFLEGKNKINLVNVNLNKNFELTDFKTFNIKTYNKGVVNNDFTVKKLEEVTILGEVFDAQPLLKSIFKTNNKKTFSKNFNEEIKINFKKALTGTNDDILNFAMIATINKGSFNKLSLKGDFSPTEIIEMSIYQIDNSKKTLQIISNRARPFVKHFDFIEGFEEGNLEYESIIYPKKTVSNLSIKNFKVSKVPALAQLLTLASLQGIADTLSGEGIRFESFEMKSSSENNVMNIEDALAMGPAVSILLDGYVDKGKTVSLRGTLVPATKLNSIIASIPIVGDILVGKKTGEGVVGVSFKMKGPPKNIKTTVNPIKTLTPRFIVRAIEKMKENKKNGTK